MLTTYITLLVMPSFMSLTLKFSSSPTCFRLSFEIGHQLSFMNGQCLIHALEFQDNLILDQNIDQKTAVESYGLVSYWQRYLAFKGNAIAG